MKIKRLVILAGVLASFGASAQMPVPLLDGADTGGKAAVQAQAGKQLEALVSDADGEKKVVVYLKKQTGKQMAKKLGVTKIDEQADTDEPSYFKQTSKKTTLLVGSASEVFLANTSIKYQSAVTCQLIK